MARCEHAPSANPRHVGLCVKCGKACKVTRRRLPDLGPAQKFIPDLASDYPETHGLHTQSHGSTDPARDLGFEARFMEDAIRVAERLHGITNRAYPIRVSHRLDIGRARYGDGAFLGKDNIVEVLEETPDLAAYAMLELQRLRRLGDTALCEAVRLDLVAVAAYGSIADWYALRAGARLRGEEV